MPKKQNQTFQTFFVITEFGVSTYIYIYIYIYNRFIICMM